MRFLNHCILAVDLERGETRWKERKRIEEREREREREQKPEIVKL
jgi:hypothetical protein